MISNSEDKAEVDVTKQGTEDPQKQEGENSEEEVLEAHTDEKDKKDKDPEPDGGRQADTSAEPGKKTEEADAGKETPEELVHQFKSILNREKEAGGTESKSPLSSIEQLKQADKNWGMRFTESSFQNSTFIINQDGGNTKAREPGENLLAVEDDREILKWCSEHYRDFYFSFFLAACILDRQPYSMIDHMAREIHQLFLQKGVERDEKEESSLIYKTRMAEILGLIEYQDFVRVRGIEVETDFLRLPDPQQAIQYLPLLIKEFPEIRLLLCDYLTKKIISTYWKRTDYMIISGCSEALSVVGAADLQFFNEQIIRRFLNERSSGTDFCLAGVLKRMYQMDPCRGFVKTCVMQWGQLRNNPHYVLASLYLCGMLGGQESLVRDIWKIVLEQVLEEVSVQEKPKDMRYSGMLAEFFDSGNRNISYYKGLIHAFYDKNAQAERDHDWRLREGVGLIFLLFIMSDLGNCEYRGMENGRKDMLSIRIMEKLDRKSGMELACLWALALQNRQWPREGWEVLEQYLGNYKAYDGEAVERLAFFFYWVRQALRNHQVDAFLQNCAVKGGKRAELASDIYKRLKRGE